MAFSINTTAVRRASLVLIVLSAAAFTANAEVINVDLTGKTEEERKHHDSSQLVETQTGQIRQLNRFTFEKTILEEHGGEVANWIVIFCAPWFEPCQALEPTFRRLSVKWQGQLNSALLTTEVRFVAVDCATEKALCNTQHVSMYPFVAHYRKHEQVRVWRGKTFEADPKRLADFLQKALGPAALALGGGAAAALGSEDEDSEVADQKIPVDLLLIFAAIAGNAWFISRGRFGAEASSNGKTCLTPPMAGGLAPPVEARADEPGSCVLRSLPKEWGRDRTSLEL